MSPVVFFLIFLAIFSFILITIVTLPDGYKPKLRHFISLGWIIITIILLSNLWFEYAILFMLIGLLIYVRNREVTKKIQKVGRR